MEEKKNSTFAEFSSTVVKANMAFKCFMRSKFKEHGIDLSFEMLQVLLCLWEKEGVKQQEIANIVLKDKASLTLLIDNLTRRKLVMRTEDVNDRRNKLVTLTEEGMQLKCQIMPWIHEMYSIAGKGISQDLLKEGILLFEKICGNLKTTVV